MDESENWFWYMRKPELQDCGWYTEDLCYASLECFDIDPIDEWTQSLRKVSK